MIAAPRTSGAECAQSAGNQHVHDRILQVLFDLLGASLADGSQDQETSVDHVSVFRFDQVDCCFKENWVDLFGLYCDC